MEELVLTVDNVALTVDMVALPFVGTQMVIHMADVLPFDEKVHMVYKDLGLFEEIPFAY